MFSSYNLKTHCAQAKTKQAGGMSCCCCCFGAFGIYVLFFFAFILACLVSNDIGYLFHCIVRSYTMTFVIVFTNWLSWYTRAAHFRLSWIGLFFHYVLWYLDVWFMICNSNFSKINNNKKNGQNWRLNKACVPFIWFIFQCICGNELCCIEQVLSSSFFILFWELVFFLLFWSKLQTAASFL